MRTSRLSAARFTSSVYPDEYLEHWANRYVRGGWLFRGVTLAQFLADPWHYVRGARRFRLRTGRHAAIAHVRRRHIATWRDLLWGTHR